MMVLIYHSPSLPIFSSSKIENYVWHNANFTQLKFLTIKALLLTSQSFASHIAKLFVRQNKTGGQKTVVGPCAMLSA